MPFNWLKQQRDQLKEGVSRYRNRDFMEGVVAACALVAAADGSIDSAEKQKMMGFIQNSDTLSVFKMEDVIAFFNKIVGKFEFDLTIGRGEAMTHINKVKRDDAQARLLVRVCIAIGAADGDFSESEKTVVRSICRELGLNPADFEL